MRRKSIADIPIAPLLLILPCSDPESAQGGGQGGLLPTSIGGAQGATKAGRAATPPGFG